MTTPIAEGAKTKAQFVETLDDRSHPSRVRLESPSWLDAPATARLSFVTGRCRLTLSPSSARSSRKMSPRRP
jgi:hypothetical protein